MEQREIKFRGKTRPYKEDDFEYMGEWVYGYYHSDEKGQCYIIQKTTTGRAYPGYPVIKESIGQYTGLKDKNGVEIYEGDIVSYLGALFIVQYSVRDSRYLLAVIHLKSDIEEAGKAATILQTHRDIPLDGLFLKVIGNIHENPSLLTK